MVVIDAAVDIARPEPDVFAFVVRGENLPRWDSSILECARLDEGALGAGARYRGASRLLGRRIEWTTEVVEYLPPRRATSVSTSGPLQFTVTYEVAPGPAGARLSYRIASHSGLSGTFGRTLEPIVERAQAKVVRANLDVLARLLEQQS